MILLIKLIVFDLDNVLIDGEAIDKIGKLKGVEKKITEITEKAMEGEIDFEESIKKRVKLLKGVAVEDIKKLAQNLQLMKGAKETINYLQEKGYKIATITGSFDIITEIIKEKLGIDYVLCNNLDHKNGILTGEVSGPLVNKSKYDVLCDLLKRENISFDECVAVGDGANDISMIESARLGIAFNAKPIVKEKADVIVEKKDLREIIPIIEELENSKEDLKGFMDLIEKKKKYENRLSGIIKERNELNRKANEKKKLRDKLNSEVKKKLDLAIKFRDKRNEINKKVEENKKLRNKTNEEIRKLKWSSSGKERFRLQRKIRRIDKIIETRVMDIKKENELVKTANELRKKLAKIQEDVETQKRAAELKRLSEKYHQNVVNLSQEAQEYHEKMLKYFKKTDEIRARADEAHQDFLKFIKLASKKHEESITIRDKIKETKNEIKKLKTRMNKINALKNHRRKILEMKKAEKIYKSFKKGKKLTKDELLLLQKYKIV